MESAFVRWLPPPPSERRPGGGIAGRREVAAAPGYTNSVRTTSAEYRVSGRSAVEGTAGHETIPANATTAVFDNDDAWLGKPADKGDDGGVGGDDIMVRSREELKAGVAAPVSSRVVAGSGDAMACSALAPVCLLDPATDHPRSASRARAGTSTHSLSR